MRVFLRAGTYREQILTAVRRRDEIEQVMARYRTKAASAAPESEEEAAAMADSVAGNWENGRLDLAVQNLVRHAKKAAAVIARAKVIYRIPATA